MQLILSGPFLKTKTKVEDKLSLVAKIGTIFKTERKERKQIKRFFNSIRLPMEIDFTDIEAAINHLGSDLRSLEDQQLLRPVLKISYKVKCILSTLSKTIVQLQVSLFIGSHAISSPGRFPGKAPWERGLFSRIDSTGALRFTCIEFDFQYLLFKKKFKLIFYAC